MLITFEGIESSGKSTLSKKLVEYFKIKNKDVIWNREPGGTELGEKIRELLLGNYKICHVSEALLFAASRAQLIEEIIKPNKDKIIILDRFVDSSIVYQGYARELGWKEVFEINKHALDGIMPDLTIVVDVNVETSFERMKNKNKDRIESEGREFFEKAREGFLKLKEWFPERNIEYISGENTLDVEYNELIAIINKYVNI
ncbi:thymidylate kinase [Marinitoga piezophila KA3]|uniref:Thymidylate kinase n=1 Tax=Marinitoga piezophila (strain DSM 14283 / JCM 11233 / KA3) TaxID=443254 RepID=H2J2Z2_MARPK|nr:dTMP kinase [Marinitoga piezophila]AEX85683.1 thymidylate kinase [Marinitoga piezophila KA3]